MSSTNQDAAIGPGLIIISTLCLGSLVIAIVLSRLDGPAKMAGLVLVPLAAMISLILWFAPRESLEGETEIDITVYDSTYYPRILILSFMVISFIASLLLYALFEILQPIYAKPLKKLSYRQWSDLLL